MPDLSALGKFVIILGVVLVVLGSLVWLAGKAGLPLGRLPGDLRLERGGVSCVIPLASSILVSLLLTLALNVIIRLINR